MYAILNEEGYCVMYAKEALSPELAVKVAMADVLSGKYAGQHFDRETGLWTDERDEVLAAGFPPYIFSLEEKVDLILTLLCGLLMPGAFETVLSPDTAILAANRGLVIETADGSQWMPGQRMVKGQLVTWQGQVYKIIQEHISQADWPPDMVPALFLPVAGDGVIPEWKQPSGAHDVYHLGDKVTYEGKIWICVVESTSYAPGVYGWEELQ